MTILDFQRCSEFQRADASLMRMPLQYYRTSDSFRVTVRAWKTMSFAVVVEV